ncbi:MAG TPA: hypothetical protein PLV92_02515 [Pirellulaceae bacterium]|nr:hypothetical protein [Pirellulaceae bacterium]
MSYSSGAAPSSAGSPPPETFDFGATPPRRRWRISDLILHGIFGIVVLIAGGAAVTLLMRYRTLAAQYPPTPQVESLPRFEAMKLEETALRLEMESRERDGGLKTTADAIRAIELQGQPGKRITVTAISFALNILREQEVPADQRRWLVKTLISSPYLPAREVLPLLDRYGEPADAELVERIPPQVGSVAEWFNLLEKWKRVPPPDKLFSNNDPNLVREILNEIGKRKLVNRPDYFSALSKMAFTPSMRNALFGHLSNEDATACATLRMISINISGTHNSGVFDLAVRQVIEQKFRPEVKELFRAEFLKEMRRVPKIETAVTFLPVLNAWNDEEMWEAAVEAVKHPSNRPSVPVRQKGVIPNLPNAAPTEFAPGPIPRSFETIIFMYAKEPTDGAAKLVAALLTHGDEVAKSWPVEALAKSKPELAAKAGITVADAGEKPASTDGGPRFPPPKPRPSLSAEQIDAALKSLAGADRNAARKAAETLADSAADEGRRAEVARELRLQLSRGGGGLSVFEKALCRWAEPTDEIYVADLASTAEALDTRVAALEYLGSVKSSQLPRVARIFVAGTDWHPPVIQAWAWAGEAGEDALCQAVVSIGDPAIIAPPAWNALAQVGGRQTLAVLKAMAAAPASNSKGKPPRPLAPPSGIPGRVAVLVDAIAALEARLK